MTLLVVHVDQDLGTPQDRDAIAVAGALRIGHMVVQRRVVRRHLAHGGVALGIEPLSGAVERDDARFLYRARQTRRQRGLWDALADVDASLDEPPAITLGSPLLGAAEL